MPALSALGLGMFVWVLRKGDSCMGLQGPAFMEITVLATAQTSSDLLPHDCPPYPSVGACGLANLYTKLGYA